MQFLNPLFFIGLIAVAIPIAVHLFNFRRYKKVYFSDISKLENLTEETRRQSRLKERLILAARILAIVFLVTAFARPFIPHGGNATSAKENLVAVYIDNSFSINAEGANGTLLETSKQKAREIAAGYSPSDRFMLITNDMSGSQFRPVSADEFLQLTDEVEPSPAAPALSTVAKRIFAALAQQNSEARSAYFISDYQKSTADLSEFPSDTLIHSYLIPLQGVAQNNLFIDSLTFSAPAFIKGNVVNINAFIRNSGDDDVESIPVQLFVNGRERAVASTSVAKNSKASVPLQFTIDGDKPLHGMVTIADHPITFDDTMFFCINPIRSIGILSVNQHSDNQYVKHLFGNDSLLNYGSCPAIAVGYEDLSQYNVIIANELSSFPTGMADALGNFVQNGGTLLVLPCKDMDISSFNRFAASIHLPQVSNFVETELKASHTNTSHPLFRNVFEPNKSGNDQPTTFAHFTLNNSSSTAKESIITLANGDDLLCCTQVGNGHIYLLTSPLQSRYTDFGSTALFVPTFYNIALYSGAVPVVYHFIDGNAAIALPSIRTNGDNTLKIKSIDGNLEAIPEIITSGGNTLICTKDNIQTAGNYVVAQGADILQGLSFNYNRQESVMDFLSPKDLKSAIKTLNTSNISTLNASSRTLDKIIREQRQGHPLWHIFVTLSLLMLATEIALIKFMNNGG